MKKFLFTLLLALGCASFAENLRAVKLNGSITIDGKLDEPAWQNALVFDKFFIDDTDLPAYPTKALLLYDDNAIYVGFHVPIPEGGKLTMTCDERDAHQVYYDDCIEVMVDPNKTSDRYFHFLINAKGGLLDRYCDQGGYVANAKWNGEIQYKCHVTDKEWFCEMSIPYFTMDISTKGSKTWGFNFAVNRRSPRQEASTAVHGAFHNASAFIPVDGIDIDLNKYGWATSPVLVSCHGSQDNFAADLTVPITNLSDIEQGKLVSVVLMGEEIIGLNTNYNFKAGEDAKINFSNIRIAKPGDYTCVVAISDPGTRVSQKRCFYPVSFKYAAFEIDLQCPHYRNFIYATQNITEVIYNVKSNIGKNVSYTTGIRTLDGKVLASKQMTGEGECRFPATPLPETKMEIFVSIDKEKDVVIPLRKLPYQKGETWIDKDNFPRVDGKRFLIIEEWSGKHIPGATVNMGNTPKEPGMKISTGDLTWSSFPARKSYLLPAILPEHEKIMRDTIKRFTHNPDMFMYYLLDEPEIQNINASGLAHAAAIIRDEDPYHFTYVSNDTIAGAKDFVESAELNGLHPYPNPQPNVPKSNFDRVVSFMDQAIAFNKTRKVPQLMCYCQQGFNYGDFGAQNSRVPTFDEIRTQYLLSFILGGKGMELYVWNENIYPELGIGFPAFIKEVCALEPALLENDVVDANFKNSNANVRTMLKLHDGEYWLFAGSTTPNVEKATFTLPQLGNKKLSIVSEDRSLQATNGAFTDTFTNYEVHIYTTAPAPKLESITSIEARIKAANEQRRKPGNLAFQMFEYDAMKIKASSNFSTYRRDDSCLWHVTDGNRTNDKHSHFQQEVWMDKTPNKCPDWIELDFYKPITTKRAVIAVLRESLKDFELQAFVNGEWKTLASVTNGKAPEFELKYDAVTSDKFRVFVTANNGPDTIIDEIELY